MKIMLRKLALAPLALAVIVGTTSAAAENKSVVTVTSARSAPKASKGARYVEGEILLDLRDDVSADDEASLAREYGITLRPNSAYSEATDKLEVVDVAPAQVSSLIARLQNDPRVAHAERMAIVRESFVPDDPLYREQWHLSRVGVESAWETACGTGVTVAVIDTGVACFDTGPFSKGTDLHGTRCEGGYNFIHDTAEAFDDEGHGTHVAGTIAQTTNNAHGVAGLAYCARIMPIKVLSEYGWGTVADVAEGIRFAADHGAQVINLSLGSPWGDDVEKEAIEYAASKGVIIVAAAGNEGEENSVGFPASYDQVIAVSATDSNDELAWFSSRGPEVDLAAPGVKVTQQTICDGGQNQCEIFAEYNGTSMASPHVAGAAALLVGMGITDPSAVRAALQSSAHPKANTDHFGAGILDAGAAVRHVAIAHLAWRVALLGALCWLLARRIKKHGGTLSTTKGMIFGALFGGIGLLPIAPWLGLAARSGRARFVVELLMRPFGEWDLVWSAGLHRWLPLANALPAVVLAALFFGVKRVRPFVGGFAVGSAALLAQLAASAEIAAPFGSTAMRAWTIVNALVCVFVARYALDRRTSV